MSKMEITPELLSRLEVIVSRLESLANLLSESTFSEKNLISQALTNTVASLHIDVVSQVKCTSTAAPISTDCLRTSAPTSASTPSTSALSTSNFAPGRFIETSGAEEKPSVKAFEEIQRHELQEFLECCITIGEDMAEMSKVVKEAFQEQKAFLARVSMCKEPPQHIVDELMGNTIALISSVQKFRESHRTSPLFNHLSMISESVLALGWIKVAPAPAPYIQEMYNAGEFYANRVLKEYRDKDESHCRLVRAWLQTLKKLESYVKEYHRTGIQWQRVGRDVLLPFCGGPPAIAPSLSQGGAPPIAPLPGFGEPPSIAPPVSCGPPPLPPSAPFSLTSDRSSSISSSASASPSIDGPYSSSVSSPCGSDREQNQLGSSVRPQDSFARMMSPRGFSKPVPNPKPSTIHSVTGPATLKKPNPVVPRKNFGNNETSPNNASK